MKLFFLALTAALLLVGGCSVTADVYGIVDGEIFTGSAKGYSDRTGNMELRSDKGTVCIGEFRYTGSASGRGLLSCNDGQRAAIQFNSLSMTSGYGFGTTDGGKAVKFTYGLSREQSARYVGAPVTSTPSSSSARGTSGTAFHVSRQGHVLTSAHVVEDCKQITLTRAGEPPVTALMVSADKVNDLAVLLSPSPSAAIAPLRTGRPVRQGESVVAYGFPLAPLLSSGGSITTGSVSALSGLQDDTRKFQISAPIQPGNSGGPLLDGSGNVVGVTSSALSALRMARITGTIPQNVNFAIKVEVVRSFLETRGIRFETAVAGRELSIPDIGERARAFTVLVNCTQ